jgi:hypothetical protein
MNATVKMISGIVEDGLFDIRDYRMLLASTNGDLRRADDAFNSMLCVTSPLPQFNLNTLAFYYLAIYLKQEKERKKGTLSSDRYYELMYDFWTSKDPQSPGRYICGIYDYLPHDKLQRYLSLLINK